jgi:serine/threonine protein kinase
MECAQSCGVTHGDLTSSNIRLDEQNKVHVSGFESSRFIDAASTLTAQVGTASYMAPESSRRNVLVTARDALESLHGMKYTR